MFPYKYIYTKIFMICVERSIYLCCKTNKPSDQQAFTPDVTLRVRVSELKLFWQHSYSIKYDFNSDCYIDLNVSAIWYFPFFSLMRRDIFVDMNICLLSRFFLRSCWLHSMVERLNTVGKVKSLVASWIRGRCSTGRESAVLFNPGSSMNMSMTKLHS